MLSRSHGLTYLKLTVTKSVTYLVEQEARITGQKGSKMIMLVMMMSEIAEYKHYL